MMSSAILLPKYVSFIFICAYSCSAAGENQSVFVRGKNPSALGCSLPTKKDSRGGSLLRYEVFVLAQMAGLFLENRFSVDDVKTMRQTVPVALHAHLDALKAVDGFSIP